MGHRDIEVDAIALWPRLIHLLEPERRSDPIRIDDRVDLPARRARRLLDVAEHGLPERTDGVDVECVDRDLHTRRRGGFAADAGVGSDLGDRPRQRHVGVGERVRGVGHQCHVDPVGIPQVDVGMVVGGLRGGGDPADELGARLERTGPETGLDPAEQHAPVGQIRARVEFRRCHLVRHDPDATRDRRPGAPHPRVCVTDIGEDRRLR